MQLRYLVIDPDRLDTDFASSLGDPNVAMGVKRTREGRPISYFVREPDPLSGLMVNL